MQRGKVELSSYTLLLAFHVQLRIMAVELLSRGVRVNAICPGYFETEMNTDFFQTDAGKAYLKRIPPGRLHQQRSLTLFTLPLFRSARAVVRAGRSLAAASEQCVFVHDRNTPCC